MQWIALLAAAIATGFQASLATRALSTLPFDRALFGGPTTCLSCGAHLLKRHQIPVASFVALGGRCPRCRTPTPKLHLVTELLVGTLALRVGLDLAHLWAASPGLALGAFIVFSSLTTALAVQALIDVRYHIIPDELSVYPVPLAIISQALLNKAGLVGALSWDTSVLGAFAGAGLLLAVAGLGFLVMRRPAMGMGDVKLMMLVGAMFGWQAVIAVVFLASILGSVAGIAMAIAQRRRPSGALPFGPFLAAATLVNWFHPELLLQIGVFRFINAA